MNVTRSKHSETEQRRRSKINERFQILRQMIPENDQKRDKASLLLEVIQYIQFLQNKLQIYEGSCQGWSPEPSKFLPWMVNSGPAESFADQSHLDRNSLGSEENAVLNSALLNTSHNAEVSDLAGAALYKFASDLPLPSNPLPLSMQILEGLSCEDQEDSLPDSKHMTRESLSHGLLMRSGKEECSVPIYSVNGEELVNENGEANVPQNYSQRLLNSLVKTLRSSGVDLSQASISVQLDVRDQADKKQQGGASGAYVDEDCGRCQKKLKSDSTCS